MLLTKNGYQRQRVYYRLYDVQDYIDFKGFEKKY